MAEFPALPLWTDAYLGDTTHLTTLEHGAYLLLLMAMWRSGDCRLPDDDKLLARYTRLTASQWARIRPVMMAFFRSADGFITQGRLTDEHNLVRRNSRKASDAAKVRWLKDKETIDADASAKQCGRNATTPTPTSVSKDTGASEQTDLLGDHAPIVLQPKSMKAVIWQNAKLIFEAAGVAKTTAGKIIGKLAAEYGDDVLVAALVAMEKERPADPTSWLMAACNAKKGKNGHPSAEWREEWILTDELANYSRSKIKAENSKSVFDRFRTVVLSGRGQVSQWPQDFRDFVDREAAKFSR